MKNSHMSSPGIYIFKVFPREVWFPTHLLDSESRNLPRIFKLPLMCHPGGWRLRQGSVRPAGISFLNGDSSLRKASSLWMETSPHSTVLKASRIGRFSGGNRPMRRGPGGSVYICIKDGPWTFQNRTCWFNSPYSAVVLVFDTGA